MATELKGSQTYDPEINGLINDLENPDYLTNAFSDIGINSLIVLSRVFRVDKSYLGSYLARVLHRNRELYKGKDVLDLGSGTGLLGVVCALNGSTSVHFADINPIAIKNSRLNGILMDVENSSFSCGSLFEQVLSSEGFDVVVFNPPSISGIPVNTYETALVREDRIISNFYESLPQYLRHEGIAIMPGSSRFDSEMSPLKMVGKYGYKFSEIDRQPEDDGNFKYVVTIHP